MERGEERMRSRKREGNDEGRGRKSRKGNKTRKKR
jgi:hypothetical protein